MNVELMSKEEKVQHYVEKLKKVMVLGIKYVKLEKFKELFGELENGYAVGDNISTIVWNNFTELLGTDWQWEDEEIMGFLDTSFFRTGTSGILLTTQRVIIKELDKAIVELDLNNIKDIRVICYNNENDSELRILFHDGSKKKLLSRNYEVWVILMLLLMFNSLEDRLNKMSEQELANVFEEYDESIGEQLDENFRRECLIEEREDYIKLGLGVLPIELGVGLILEGDPSIREFLPKIMSKTADESLEHELEEKIIALEQEWEQELEQLPIESSNAWRVGGVKEHPLASYFRTKQKITDTPSYTFIGKRISKSQIENASRKWAPGITKGNDKVLLFGDTSLFTNGKDGIAFTEQSVYYKPFWERPIEVMYQDIKDITPIQEDGDIKELIVIDCYDNQHRLWNNSNINFGAVYEILVWLTAIERYRTTKRENYPADLNRVLEKLEKHLVSHPNDFNEWVTFLVVLFVKKEWDYRMLHSEYVIALEKIDEWGEEIDEELEEQDEDSDDWDDDDNWDEDKDSDDWDDDDNWDEDEDSEDWDDDNWDEDESSDGWDADNNWDEDERSED